MWIGCPGFSVVYVGYIVYTCFQVSQPSILMPESRASLRHNVVNLDQTQLYECYAVLVLRK